MAFTHEQPELGPYFSQPSGARSAFQPISATHSGFGADSLGRRLHSSRSCAQFGRNGARTTSPKPTMRSCSIRPGPPTYLSSDGRIVWDDDISGVVGTRAEAYAAILAGVKTGVLELRDLLPPRELSSADCSECSATGWFDAHGQLKDVHGKSFSFVCPKCAGLGWTSPSVVLTDSVLELANKGAEP